MREEDEQLSFSLVSVQLGFSKSGNSREWRIPLAIQIIPAIFLGALIFLFPESPRYF